MFNSYRLKIHTIENQYRLFDLAKVKKKCHQLISNLTSDFK